MRTRWATMLAAAAGSVALVVGLTTPAYAVHLFPLTPVVDPLGHDCAKALGPAPGDAAATVATVGFRFVDNDSLTSTSTVPAGEAVTWTWLLDHCHSVTFSPTLGTHGGTGFLPAEPQLVRMDGVGNDSFSLTFGTPGTHSYICVHHGAVGMVGTVVVT